MTPRTPWQVCPGSYQASLRTPTAWVCSQCAKTWPVLLLHARIAPTHKPVPSVPQEK